MLAQIQAQVKAPKGQVNKFGNYKYRSCEDIVEAVKPVINKLGYYLTLNDEIVQIGERIYVKATATISNGESTFSCSAFAREEEVKKGMDSAQITGAASSYARKYALNGLFAIDDTKDADATNTHEKDGPTAEEKQLLRKLLNSSNLDDYETEQAFKAIEVCNDYDTYQKIQHRLEDRQLGLNEIPNPNQKDISNHLKKSVK
jgi:hypothetical protein